MSLHIVKRIYNQIKKNHQLKTLSQTQVYPLKKDQSYKMQETPLCTSCKNKMQSASLTLETAMALPLFLLFATAVLFLFRAMEIQQGVEEAMEYAVRKTAVRAHTTQEADFAGQDLLSGDGAVKAVFLGQLEELEVPIQYVKGGLSGFSYTESDAGEEYVELAVSYRIRNPISFFGLLEYEVHQRAKSHRWIGRIEEEDSSDELVYITETGTAYHQSKDCPYLDLSIHAVPELVIESLRNASGGKYKDCEKCRQNKSTHGIVYVTDYGDACHNSISCSGLKRTVHMVVLEDLEGYHPCSKCVR